MALGGLLAKKPVRPDRVKPEETLLGHSLAVESAFRALFGADTRPSRLACALFRFCRLPERAIPSFYATTRAACLLHDTGKGNNWFQDLLRKSGVQQAIRHERLSALLLVLPEVHEFVASQRAVEPSLLLAAIAGHHLRSWPDGNMRAAFTAPPERPFFRMEPAVRGLFAALAPEGGDLPIPERWASDGSEAGDVLGLSEIVVRRLNKLQRTLHSAAPDGSGTDRLLMLIRLALILSDAAGSGLVRTGRDIHGYIKECFEGAPITTQDIESKVITPRLRQIEAYSDRPFTWHDFQVAASALPDRALLLSSCGSGKTLAAWRWIAARLAERPAMRAIFLYPTRASATEGFRDYVSWAPEDEGALLHGTASYELEGLLDQPMESDDPRRGKAFGLDPRLFSLGAWPRRIFSATVDQFLGFMRHGYAAMCLTPLLADAVLVVDEVHSFDPHLFSMLERMLREFDLPVLCMTASLPPHRRRRLMDAGLTVFPGAMEEFPDLQAKAEAGRYLVRMTDAVEAREAVDQALSQRRRVLWIFNTVDRCQSEARVRAGALCYHSRFRLQDRKTRHRETVEAFRANRGGQADFPVFAATTQVCEMSLDLDADLLVTELAPIPSLIQRMGRCNRHLRAAGGIGRVLVIQPENELPYAREDLDAALVFVRDLHGQEVSQARLEELLEKHCPAAVEGMRYAAFLEDGAWASCGEPLRETEEFTVPAVLSGDVEEYFRLKRAGLPVDGLVVPTPRSTRGLIERDPRLGRLARVDSALYNERLGLLKSPKEEIW